MKLSFTFPINEPELEMESRVERSSGGTQQASMTLMDEVTEPCMRPMRSRTQMSAM